MEPVTVFDHAKIIIELRQKLTDCYNNANEGNLTVARQEALRLHELTGQLITALWSVPYKKR